MSTSGNNNPGPIDLSRKAVLEEVIAEGGSMSVAAARLNITRSMVSGSARRLGLKFPEKAPTMTEETKQKISEGMARYAALNPRPKKTGKSGKQVAAELREKRKREPGEITAPKAKRKGLGLCMWAGCSCAPVAAGKPFCVEHAREARAGVIR